ncbi:restriction endonuclease subunit S [Phocaeicola plebeius]|uniref:restriction endonuclease subunit S n=1 Tax=Phocaeicola plebeius TaxID=310297 RepID=UPI00195DDFC6|nr:restriction endonuclease subunit S [Phocaeicola plebeius]MBM6843065.1 restriction endonuclease subunit S [Phocaeicola plebeius]
MDEWKEYKLGEVCDVRDGTHDSPKECSYGKPLVTSKNIKNGRIDLVNTYLISDKDYDSVNRRSKVDVWDVLFSMIGTVGECAIVKDTVSFAIKNVGLFKTGGNELLAKWIYYYFQSNSAKTEIDAKIKGSTQQYIALGDLRSFPILFPSIEIQRYIIGILECIDDKIDLLHQENKTLEAMAETLFRKWFIEEVRQDVLLGNVVETTSGGTPSRKNEKYYQNGTIDWVKSKELNRSFLLKTEEKITVEAVENSSAKFLPANSVLIAMYGATVGEYAIITKEMTCNQAVCALKPNDNYPYTYLYLWAKFMQDEFLNLACGAAQQNISQVLIKQQQVCSDVDAVKQFHSIVEPFFEKLKQNEMQLSSLEEMKHVILPKLMNNELNINEL